MSESKSSTQIDSSARSETYSDAPQAAAALLKKHGRRVQKLRKHSNHTFNASSQTGAKTFVEAFPFRYFSPFQAPSPTRFPKSSPIVINAKAISSSNNPSNSKSNRKATRPKYTNNNFTRKGHGYTRHSKSRSTLRSDEEAKYAAKQKHPTTWGPLIPPLTPVPYQRQQQEQPHNRDFLEPYQHPEYPGSYDYPPTGISNPSHYPQNNNAGGFSAPPARPYYPAHPPPQSYNPASTTQSYNLAPQVPFGGYTFPAPTTTLPAHYPQTQNHFYPHHHQDPERPPPQQQQQQRLPLSQDVLPPQTYERPRTVPIMTSIRVHFSPPRSFFEPLQSEVSESNVGSTKTNYSEDNNKPQPSPPTKRTRNPSQQPPQPSSLLLSSHTAPSNQRAASLASKSLLPGTSTPAPFSNLHRPAENGTTDPSSPQRPIPQPHLPYQHFPTLLLSQRKNPMTVPLPTQKPSSQPSSASLAAQKNSPSPTPRPPLQNLYNNNLAPLT